MESGRLAPLPAPLYRERVSAIPGAVRWRSVGRSGTALILPDGCMDIIVTDRGTVVAGPDAVAAHVPMSDGAPFDGLRFAPGVLPQLLGIAADELTGTRVELSDVLPHRRSPRSRDPEAIAAALLEEVELDHRVTGVAALLAAGRPIGGIAAETGLGERALHRLARRSFGYSPKTLARILRFQQALNRIRSGMPLSDVAASSGYADQAHLTRDVRALTSVTPVALRATS